MKSDDMTREQLIEELVQVRYEVGEIADRLNNTLMAVLVNIGLAKTYEEKGKILEKLLSAEKAFPEIKVLTQRMLNIAHNS